MEDESADKTLLEVFKYHNDEMKGLIGKGFAEGTYKRFIVTVGKVKGFLKVKYNKSGIFLSELKYKFITDFEYYLKTTDKLDHNTAMSYIKKLKKIVAVAVKKDWLDKNPFLAFKCTPHDVQLAEYSFENSSRQRIKGFSWDTYTEWNTRWKEMKFENQVLLRDLIKASKFDNDREIDKIHVEGYSAAI